MDKSKYTTEELIELSKIYAGDTFKACIDPNSIQHGHDNVPRHRQNNATKIVGLLMRQDTDAKIEAPELGIVLQEIIKAGDKPLRISAGD